MNMYSYWFLFIYNLYYKFSKDKDFYIFALGLFTALGFFTLISLFFYIDIFCKTNIIKSILSSYNIYILIAIIFALNFYLFIFKNKHKKLLTIYLEKQTNTKDIFCLILTIASIIAFFHTMLYKNT